MTVTFADIASQKMIRDRYSPEPDFLRIVREETSLMGDSFLQISADQGIVLKMLAAAVEAKLILEVGVYAGYSALWLASALPTDGKLIGCDIDAGLLEIACGNFEHCGLDAKIETRLGDAAEVIENLIEEGYTNRFDLAFIDADKEPIDRYYEGCLRLVRVGGLIVIDNVLWEGRVAQSHWVDADTAAMRNLLDKSLEPISKLLKRFEAPHRLTACGG